MLLDTPLCDFGAPAPTFTLPDLDRTPTKIEDVMGEQGLLVAFICNHCPYVKAIINRLVDDAKVLQDAGVGIVAIMPNDYKRYPADAPEQMLDFAQTHGFTFPYLLDEDQSIAKAYGAVCTPDFFGYNAEAKLHYRGRLDDAKMGDASERNPELLQAMLQIAETGQGPKEQSPSMGCSIKWLA